MLALRFLGVFRVRALSRRRDGDPRAGRYTLARMGYPKRLLDDDEVVVKEFRPHWSRIIKEILLSIAVGVVLVLVGVVLDLPQRGWIIAAIAVIWFVLVIRGLLSWYLTQHVITNERVIYRAGIFSREGKEIPLEVINDVSFSQRFWERLVRSGARRVGGRARSEPLPGHSSS